MRNKTSFLMKRLCFERRIEASCPRLCHCCTVASKGVAIENVEVRCFSDFFHSKASSSLKKRSKGNLWHVPKSDFGAFESRVHGAAFLQHLEPALDHKSELPSRTTRDPVRQGCPLDHECVGDAQFLLQIAIEWQIMAAIGYVNA